MFVDLTHKEPLIIITMLCGSLWGADKCHSLAKRDNDPVAPDRPRPEGASDKPAGFAVLPRQAVALPPAMRFARGLT
jgi:hypothetical protein